MIEYEELDPADKIKYLEDVVRHLQERQDVLIGVIRGHYDFLDATVFKREEGSRESG